MTAYDVKMYAGFFALGYSIILGLLKYKELDGGSRILLLLLLSTFVSEVLAEICARTIRNSLVVYGIFNPIQLMLIALYFSNSTRNLENKKIVLFIGGLLMLWGFTNYFFIESPMKMNTAFLLTESIVVVAMCFYSFYKMLLDDDDLRLVDYPHFWFTAIFLFFWSGTFLIWGLYGFMIDSMHIDAGYLHTSLLAINLIAYLGFGTVFLFYKKMHATNE